MNLPKAEFHVTQLLVRPFFKIICSEYSTVVDVHGGPVGDGRGVTVRGGGGAGPEARVKSSDATQLKAELLLVVVEKT